MRLSYRGVRSVLSRMGFGSQPKLSLVSFGLEPFQWCGQSPEAPYDFWKVSCGSKMHRELDPSSMNPSRFAIEIESETAPGLALTISPVAVFTLARMSLNSVGANRACPPLLCLPIAAKSTRYARGLISGICAKRDIRDCE